MAALHPEIDPDGLCCGAAGIYSLLHPDALGTGPHRGLDRLAHGPAERHTSRELLGDTLGDELGVELGVLDLEDVQLHLLAGELLELAPQLVGLLPATSDDDAGTGRVDVHPHPVARALDLDARDAGALHALAEQSTDSDVLGDVVRVHLVGVPARRVVAADPEAKALRVDLLTHQRSLLDSTTTVMWLVRLRMR